MIELPRSLCGEESVAAGREWLVTNGLGGYASGTVAGILTRRYHGVLVAALKPPLARTLLVSKIDETASYDGRIYALSANRWLSGVTDPTGFVHLDRFHLEGTVPVWTFTIADAELEKRIWMQQGANTTFVRYDFVRGSRPLELALKAFVNYRDYHGNTQAGGWRMQVQTVPSGLCVTPFEEAQSIYLLSDVAQATAEHTWYRDFFLAVESFRELSASEDHLHTGTFNAVLAPGESLSVVVSTQHTSDLDTQVALADRHSYERTLISLAGAREAPTTVRQLILGADQFIVRRSNAVAREGHSVIAGYPWFGDWGRDTMIALPGLTLCTGRPEVAESILRTFAHHVDRGMLPNRFPDDGEKPEYNTVDATLWFFEAIRAYLDATGNEQFLRDLFPVLKDIVDWHQRGTRYGIHVDPEDGLICAGEPGVQLTWMDAKVGDWVVTPRIGKPVEINGLWYHVLRCMGSFSRRLDLDDSAFEAEAERVKASFRKFWSSELGYCYDVVDSPDGNDPSLRPNQLFAVSLKHSPLSPPEQKAIVDICARQLLTPHGLRSLAPGDPAYTGRYHGGPRSRDGSYHQGTVWSWLVGPFSDAHLRVYRDPGAVRAMLQPLLRHLSDHAMGSMSEIFDGDPPHAARGAVAQAWSVAEVLRIWRSVSQG